MKKFTLLLVALLFITGSNYAQRNFAITLGTRSVSYSGRSIQLYYRDESPAPDNFYTNINLSSNTLYNFGFSFNRFTPDNYYVGFDLDVYFSAYFAASLGASFGVPFYLEDNRRLRFVPMISAGLGLYRKDLGVLENNTTWIQVNDIQFDDYENVSLSLTAIYGYITPSFRTMYQLKPNVDLFVSLGYAITFEGSPDVDFGGNSDGESVVATEELGANNIAFYVDNRRTNDSPFNLSGFEIKIGANVRW